MSTASVVHALGWTLVDFLWQGALTGCATAAVLAVLRNARPERRYLAACMGLLACFLWPLATLAQRLLDQGGAHGSVARLMPRFDAGNGAAGFGWNALIQDNVAWIVAGWAACAALLALRMGVGLLWIGRAARREAIDAEWQLRLQRMAEQCGLTRTVRLRVVERLASPVTAGCWRPVVLVPASLISGMSPNLLEALLAHELGHIKRHDYLVNLFQNVVETLLFYHPAVWWLSHRIRVEREQIADDFAARQLGEPRRLALALSELEKRQFSTHHLAPAANGGDLMSRIKRLVRPDAQASNWKAALPVLGLAAMSVAVFAHAAPAAKLAEPEQIAIVDFASCERPHYPAESLKNKHTGTVSLGFLVTRNGKVQQTRIEESSGHPLLDEAARTALAKCSFKPASTKGKPVDAWTRVQYVWSLD